MRLTLTYRGRLPAKQRGISPIKSALRQAFHPQIKEQVSRRLSQDRHEAALVSNIEGHEFLAPVHDAFRTAVELDVLMLTGTALRPGDSDNRLKTLIDGLTRPASVQQLEGHVDPPEGGPTFCLLDDDKLVQRVTLDSRRWYEPVKRDETLVVVSATIVLSELAGMDSPFSNIFLLL